MTLFKVTLELTGHKEVGIEAYDVLEARELARLQLKHFCYQLNETIETIIPIRVTNENNVEVWSI